MSRIMTYVYAHNNQEDALRFRDQVHEILRGNKRYIANKIMLVSQQEPVVKNHVLPSEEDGNMLLQINGYPYYHCVKIVFIYEDQELTPTPAISIFYKNGDRFCADNCPHSYTSQMSKSDLNVLHKIAKLYLEDFEFGKLDEDILVGPQVGVYPSRKFSTTDVFNTTVDQENLNTEGSSTTPHHLHHEPAMISWVDKLDSLMSKDDPDYDRFQKFKELWKETIATGIAAKNLRLNCFKSVDAGCDVSWLKVLPDPKDCDGDVPNIKGLKDLIDKIIKYTSVWNNTGIKEIDNRMTRLCVEMSRYKSILEGKAGSIDLVFTAACPTCNSKIVVNPGKEELAPKNTWRSKAMEGFFNDFNSEYEKDCWILTYLKSRLRDLPSNRYLSVAKETRDLLSSIWEWASKPRGKITMNDEEYDLYRSEDYNCIHKYLERLANIVRKDDVWKELQCYHWIATRPEFERRLGEKHKLNDILAHLDSACDQITPISIKASDFYKIQSILAELDAVRNTIKDMVKSLEE